MTVEYLPVGIKCNLKCTYCYQEPMREAGHLSSPVNFLRAKEAIIKSGSDFAIFGGEPLLTPIEHLEEMWRYGYERFGKNGIQTNGALITKSHIELFKRYKVGVGISIDGPGLCNSARCDSDLSSDIIGNLRECLAAKVDVSLIVTIHRLNFGLMPELLDFFRDMEKSGVKWINLHNLEVDNKETADHLMLSDEENFQAFRTIYDFSKNSRLSFLPFSDIRRLLTKSNPSTSCIWSGCDHLSTPAVHGINSEGSLVNCGRTNKTGIDYLKEKSFGLERYQALALTAQEDGGCQDCKYFFACKGQCPGTAIDGDPRNRTKDCIFWFSLIDYMEQDLRSEGIEILDFDENNQKFISKIFSSSPHNDTPHGDSHGDSHGDHTDVPRGEKRAT